MNDGNVAHPAAPSAPRHLSPPWNRWAMVRGAYRTVGRFRADWSRLPRDAWQRWLWTVTWGLLGGGLGMFALSLFMRRLDRMGELAWERDALRWTLEASPLAFNTAIWAETPGNGVFMIPVMLCAALLAVWLHRPLVALSILASYFMLDLIVGVGWLTWARERPELVLGGAASPGLHAFPSGHVAQVISAYGFLIYLWMRTSDSAAERLLAVLLLMGATAVISLARLVLGAHWPSDMAAGALVGGFWLTVTITALRRAEAMLPCDG